MKLHPREQIVDLAECRAVTEFSARTASLRIFSYETRRSVLAAMATGRWCLLRCAEHGARPLAPATVATLADWWRAFVRREGLTEGETARVVAGLAASDAKYWIRMERHGRADRPGGLE